MQVTKSAEALLQQESALLERSSQASTGSKHDLLQADCELLLAAELDVCMACR